MCLTDRQAMYTASTIFGAAALLHAVRVFSGWDLALNGWLIPTWVSVLVIIVAGYLSWYFCPLRSQKK